MRLACVSVDLDSIPHYCRIHGLDPARLTPEGAGAVYGVALGRFLDLFAETPLLATFFAVGEDLAEPGAASALKDAARAGHEVGNHTASHDYALTRRAPEAIAEEIAAGERAIETAVGVRPVGFRAPGYTISGALVRALVARGYAYDASAFPAAAYWLAKAGILGALAVLGRRSRAILDHPRVLLAPREPYRPDLDEPYKRGAAPLLELPMAVEPWTRVPLIGTSAVLLPRAAVRRLYASLRKGDFLSFELHGIDLLEHADVGDPALAREQRELRIPWPEKRARLREVIGWLARDYRLETLAGAAGMLGG